MQIYAQKKRTMEDSHSWTEFCVHDKNKHKQFFMKFEGHLLHMFLSHLNMLCVLIQNIKFKFYFSFQMDFFGTYKYTSDAPEPTFWWAEPSFLTSEPSQAEL